jgi:protein gp37
MGENSGIEWTDHTFNPWWGCVKVSEACTHCYAETFAKRMGTAWGPSARRKFFGDNHWQEPVKWNRRAGEQGRRRRVFCASMADVFEMLPPEHPDHDRMADERWRLFKLIDATPNLDWLLLTKRPDNARHYFPGYYQDDPPAANIWCGTTVESIDHIDRIDELLDTPAVVRFLSVEPLLGPLDLGLRNWADLGRDDCRIDWVIVGGESGKHARAMHPAWVRLIRDDCKEAGVPFFFKQWGEYITMQERESCSLTPDDILASPRGRCDAWGRDGIGQAAYRVGKRAAGRLLDGKEYSEFPVSRPVLFN